MFVADAEIERNTLRQGDILRAVHLVGALHLQGIHLVNDQANKSVGWTVPKAPEFGDVLSHSCEIDLLNNVKLISIILAPVRDLHSATDPGKRQELIDSNIITPGTAGSYLKYFYLAPHEKLEHKAGGVFDFSSASACARTPTTPKRRSSEPSAGSAGCPAVLSWHITKELLFRIFCTSGIAVLD